ncbi:MAG: PAS domain S-box protein, partial [Methanotrichaceae archaeon]
MTTDTLSQRVSELSQRLEELQVKCSSNPANAAEILSDALESLQTCIDEIKLETLKDTERKKAEERIRYLANLVDTVPDAIISTDNSYHITSWNKAAEITYGWRAEEVIGKISSEVLNSRYPNNETVEEIRDKFRRNELIFFEAIHTTKTGREVNVLGRSNTVRDSEGKTIGIVSIFRDITERKKAEEALHDSEEKFRLFMDNSPAIAWMKDEQGGHVYFNKTCEKQFGIRLDDLYGKTDFDIWPKQIAEQFRKNDQMALAAGRPIEVVEENFNPDGSRCYWQNFKFIIQDSSGRKYIAGIGADITRQKQAEEALQKAHDELEIRVKERTADLEKTNEELLKAKDAAEEAIRAKAAFLANMSHELRTPMNSIIGFTSLLLMEPLPPEYKDWLDNMRTNGEALLALINDVLDFSKIEKEKIELEIHPFDLRQQIEESLDLVSTKAAEKGLDLAYTMDSNVPETIISDSARLRQVLANLLSNAVKFTDTGDVLVQVSSKPDGDLHEIHFAVQDTGIGMPQNQMIKLFQPFSQIVTSPKLNEGTGLGLAISKKLVELMGGKIWAQSEEGKGSTFHFTIKAMADHIDKTGKLPSRPQPQLARRNVLIMDDNNTLRRILGRQTLSWGMIPFIVSSGYEALKMIQNGVAIDVAILDIDMTDMDGIALAEMIHSYRKDMPLIMLTSAGQHIPQDLPAVSLTKP